VRALRSGTTWSVVLFIVVLTSYEFLSKYPLVGILTPFIAYVTGVLIGVAKGRFAEKKRALALCHQCLQQIWSGSVRRVMNGIQEDRTKLLSEDEFFGPEPGVPSVQSPNDSQERPPPDA